MKLRYLSGVVTLEYDSDKCKGCGRCLEVCPHGVFVMENGKARVIDRDACIECGACMKNCPFDAINVDAGVGCAAAVFASKGNSKDVCCGSEAVVAKYRNSLIVNSDGPREVIKMQDEKKKKGLFSAIWESMTKTGGCCGSGESCGSSPQPDNSKKKTDPKKEKCDEQS